MITGTSLHGGSADNRTWNYLLKAMTKKRSARKQNLWHLDTRTGCVQVCNVDVLLVLLHVIAFKRLALIYAALEASKHTHTHARTHLSQGPVIPQLLGAGQASARCCCWYTHLCLWSSASLLPPLRALLIWGGAQWMCTSSSEYEPQVLTASIDSHLWLFNY